MVQCLLCCDSLFWVLGEQFPQEVLTLLRNVSQGSIVLKNYVFLEDLLFEFFRVSVEERQIIWQKFKQNNAKGPAVNFVVVISVREDFRGYGDQGAALLGGLVPRVIDGGKSEIDELNNNLSIIFVLIFMLTLICYLYFHRLFVILFYENSCVIIWRFTKSCIPSSFICYLFTIFSY